jgi:hypothetical protein
MVVGRRTQVRELAEELVLAMSLLVGCRHHV